MVGINYNNRKTTLIGGGSRRRTSSTTQAQIEVVTRAAQTVLDRRTMSCTIVVAHTSRLLWRRSNLASRATPSLLARRGAPLARPLWECRRLGLWGRCRLPAQGPRRRSLSGSGSWRHQPGNRRHRVSGWGSRGHRSHRPGVHRGAHSRATVAVARAWVGAVANESGWGVKNWTLALRVFFYRRPDLVRLDQIAPSDLDFL
jgi:hypothetical protein